MWVKRLDVRQTWAAEIALAPATKTERREKVTDEVKYGTRVKASILGVDVEVFAYGAEGAVTEFAEALKAVPLALAAKKDPERKRED